MTWVPVNDCIVAVNTTIYWLLLIKNTWLHVSTRISLIFWPWHYTGNRNCVTQKEKLHSNFYFFSPLMAWSCPEFWQFLFFYFILFFLCLTS